MVGEAKQRFLADSSYVGQRLPRRFSERYPFCKADSLRIRFSLLAELLTSLVDAVDGSSTRHVSAMDVGAVKAPTIRRS